jgi:hypothetical protein
MTPRALVLALAALLVVPAAASAGTASVAGATITFTAAAGETNQLGLTYSADAGTYSFHDNTAPVAAGPGCRAIGTDEAACPAAGVSQVAVDLGDGDDTGASPGPYPAPVTVHGGPGADDLSGSGTQAGDDGRDRLAASDSGATLDGGPGNDDLYDGLGNDQIFGGAGDDYVVDNAGADLLAGGLGDDQLEIHGTSATIDCQGRDDDSVQPDTKATLRNCLPAPVISVRVKHVTVRSFVKRGLPFRVTCDHDCAIGFSLFPTQHLPFHGGGTTLSYRFAPRTATGYLKPTGSSESFVATAGGRATRKAIGRLKRAKVKLQVVAYSRDGLMTTRTQIVTIG